MGTHSLKVHYAPKLSRHHVPVNLDREGEALGSFRDLLSIDSTPDEANETVYLMDSLRFANVDASEIVKTLEQGLNPKIRVYVSNRSEPRLVFRDMARVTKAIEAIFFRGDCKIAHRICMAFCRLFHPPSDLIVSNPDQILYADPMRPFLGRFAFIFLACGDLENGWLYYEATKNRGEREGKPPYPQPFWNGESLTGRRIIVWRNHGPGDEILYAEMLNDLIEQAESVIIETDPRLETLFARSFPGSVIVPRPSKPHGAEFLDAADFQATLGGVARQIRRTVRDFGKSGKYLRSDQKQVYRWQSELRSDDFSGPLVGIAWRSGRNNSDESYNTEVMEWLPVFKVPGVRFVPLLYDDWSSEIELVSRECAIDVAEPTGLDMFNDIDGQAALIEALDLVIGVNTISTNLAGGLGVNCWEMGPWWLHCYMGTDRNPWFPNTRLWQQERGRGNDEIMRDFADNLERLEEKVNRGIPKAANT